VRDRHRARIAKIGLGVFLAVAGSLFALLVSAYSMRMGMADWRTLPMPTVLWFSTGLLILSSIALQATVIAARRDELDGVRSACSRPGVLAGLSRRPGAGMAGAGRRRLFRAANPAGAFFYLVTAIHGLHMLGGLVALNRTAVKAFAWMGSTPQAAECLAAQRRALRHLLALPAPGLARPVQPADALDRRSHRNLPGIAELARLRKR
jgi:cytochrome c oxidase subunit 3